MSRLADWMVELADGQEGILWVDGAQIEDLMDAYGQKRGDRGNQL
jgi:hypothetical protein